MMHHRQVIAFSAALVMLCAAAPERAVAAPNQGVQRVEHIHRQQGRRLLRPALWAAALTGAATGTALYLTGGGLEQLPGVHQVAMHWGHVMIGGAKSALGLVQQAHLIGEPSAKAALAVGGGAIFGASIGTLRLIKNAIFH